MLMNKDNSLLLIIDVQERLVTAMDSPREVINCCAKLVSVAKRLNIPFLITEQYPKGLGQTIVDVRQAAGPDAGYFEKLEFSVMRNEKIAAAVKNSGKKQVVIAGVETHICVLQTAMELAEQGYAVFVVSNACSSRENLQHAFALQRMARNGIDVVSSEMVIFEWLEKAGTEEFKEISRKYVI